MQKLFHIDDPNGVRKKIFLRALAARFRNHKAEMVARFINKKNAPKEGNPNADKKPWELYQGFITEEQWKIFEAYVASDQFKVRSISLLSFFAPIKLWWGNLTLICILVFGTEKK